MPEETTRVWMDGQDRLGVQTKMYVTVTAAIIIGTARLDLPPQSHERFAKSPTISLGEASDLTASCFFIDVDGDGDLDILLAKGRHWPAPNTLVINSRDAAVPRLSPALGTSHPVSLAFPLGPAPAPHYVVHQPEAVEV